PLDTSASTLVSPCDGAWGESGEIREGTLFQLKGRPYSLAELLNDSDAAGALEGGCFATFYLAPRDYHRFHAPCALQVTRAKYVPGSLWPVNSLGLAGVDGLFAQNERLCIFGRTGAGAGELALVAVGATLVGKVRVRFDDLSTQSRPRRPVERRDSGGRARFAKGEALGRFEFGSTLVLLLPPGFARLAPAEPGEVLRLGRPVARLETSHTREPETA
ncbi:MAG: phosphatidylserine decarboxylase, partial [Proteobacteria bacterium]|nr:phosphatidylserine decarboxylase [Pseudomonadota bacterium]